MRNTPLITFTKADDAGCGQRDPGDLDYAVNGDALARWLSNGYPMDVAGRARILAAELRAMADDIERGSGPVAPASESARTRYAEHVRLVMRRENAVATTR